MTPEPELPETVWKITGPESFESSAVGRALLAMAAERCPECGGPADDGAGHDCEAQ